jgi:predicted MFS family arabinose efflux permease
MIRADLGPMIKEPQPIRDLVAEGFRYVFKEDRLRVIFLLEAATSVFGVFYLGLMAAIAKTKLGLGASGLGNLFTAIGVGAVIGLLLVSTISGRPVKFTIVRVAMSMVAIALCLLAWAPNQAIAMVCLAMCGMGTIMQFNTSNTLFQLIAPAHLRGRALAMHMWAVSGVAPAGILIFGWVADHFGINAALGAGGGILLAWSVWGWIRTWSMQDPAYDTA